MSSLSKVNLLELRKRTVRRRIVIRLKVKEIAEEREISMSKLSRMSDVHYNTIRDIFIHPYRDVALSTLYKLAVALNVDIHDLYKIVPDEEK